ncbi:MAG: hypothetical protein HN348_18705 [Proteobacteria bacterium]|nr:hypothetical protein [Pseudomonadota bacterium]
MKLIRQLTALLLVLWPTCSVADEPEDEAPDADTEADEDVDEQITIFGDRLVEKRRAELDAEIRDLGYYKGKELVNGSTVYRPLKPWKPSVIVDNYGFVKLKRSPVRVGVPREVSPWFNLLCPLAPTQCVRLGGQIVSPRKLDAAKGKVLEKIEPRTNAWQEAIAGTALQRRIDEEVPAMLDTIWNDSDTIPQEKRLAILDFWSSRTCSAEGNRVADVVEAFLEHEVQSSLWPLAAAEIEAANEQVPCSRRLHLMPD